MSIMEIKQVGYSYDNKKKVLKGVNAEIDVYKRQGVGVPRNKAGSRTAGKQLYCMQQ